MSYPSAAAALAATGRAPPLGHDQQHASGLVLPGTRRQRHPGRSTPGGLSAGRGPPVSSIAAAPRSWHPGPISRPGETPARPGPRRSVRLRAPACAGSPGMSLAHLFTSRSPPGHHSTSHQGDLQPSKGDQSVRSPRCEQGAATAGGFSCARALVPGRGGAGPGSGFRACVIPVRQRRVPSDRNGGNCPGKAAAVSWKICSGRPRSFSRCTPRSASATPSGSPSRTSTAAASDTSTCPRARPRPPGAARGGPGAPPGPPGRWPSAPPPRNGPHPHSHSLPTRPPIRRKGLLHLQHRRHTGPR
jgi:hypothetical protein